MEEITSAMSEIISQTENVEINNHSVSLFDNSNAVNNGGNIYLTMIWYLLAIAAVIGLLLLIRKYLLRRMGNIKNGSYMRIRDRIALSQDKQIILVEMQNKILVVGITQQRIETLSEFEKSELELLTKENDNAGTDIYANNKFLNILNNKFNGNANKNDENNKK